MSRLKSLLRVACPSTRNTQQEQLRTSPDVVGHESSQLLHGAFTDPRNTQQKLLRCCTPVAQHAHTAQQAGIDTTFSDQWREFETLLAIVGPAYRTPEHEYAEMRAAACGDLPGALMAYREMAAQIKDAQHQSNHKTKDTL